MMVPIFHDAERRRTKVWVVLGWTRKPLRVAFARAPRVRLEGESAVLGATEIKFGTASYHLAHPVSAEVYVNRLLDRDELRALCDRAQTQKGILEALDRLR